MKANKHISSIKIISSLTLFVFISFLLISFFTLHIHQLFNGEIVVHSHLVSDTQGEESFPGDNGGHTHSEIEYLFYSLISVDKFSFNFFILSFVFTLFLITVYKNKKQNIDFYFTPFLFNLRAPPLN